MDLGYEWTEYPIDSGAKISDHGAKLPEKFAVSGLLTTCPLAPDTNIYADDPGTTRVANALEKLQKLADAMQPITLVAKYWSPADVVIDSVAAAMGQGIGAACRVDIAVHQITIVKPEAVNIPASKYQAKVKRKAPGKKGGAAAGSTPGSKSNGAGKSWAKGLSALFGGRS